MPKLIAITLGAVAAVLAWVWFSRRPVLGKPLANERPIDGQPPSMDTVANQRADSGLSAPAMNGKFQDQSTEAPHELTIESLARAVTNAAISTVSDSEGTACAPTDEIGVGTSLVPNSPSGESAVPVPIEKIEIHPISVAVSCLPSNETIRDPMDETARESEENHARFASLPIASPQEKDMVGQIKGSVIQPFVPGTTTPTPSANLACVGETDRQPCIADEELAELSTPLDTTAVTLPITTPSSGRKAEAATGGGTEAPPVVVEPLRKARSFSEPKPSPTRKIATHVEQTSDPTPRTNASLPIRLQLVFGGGGIVKKLALIPHRCEGMPSSLEVTTIAGDRLQFSELTSDSYEPVSVSEVPNTLSEGVVLQARGDMQEWRWELSRREIYVLAAGDAFGLSGFVTRRKDQRLWLNTRHVVLAKESLCDQVIDALNEAGCAPLEVCDSTTLGVPTGWILIRNVTPTRAVPMCDEHNILNVLCPGHETEPQFIGGIRLERSAWLVGFPPRIRFAGELGTGFQVLIDDQPATLTSDGAFESPGWDNKGEHRLWFGDRAQTYVLRTMKEEWDAWPAHDCGVGTAICGASTYRIDNARWRQCCIPATNPLLIGARPGEIFHCRVPNDAETEWVLTSVPFTPVWALPSGRIPKKSCPAVIQLIEFIEPLNQIEQSLHKLKVTSALRKWVFVVRNARRNRFVLAIKGEEAYALWRRYGDMAKKLRKQMR